MSKSAYDFLVALKRLRTGKAKGSWNAATVSLVENDGAHGFSFVNRRVMSWIAMALMTSSFMAGWELCRASDLVEGPV